MRDMHSVRLVLEFKKLVEGPVTAYCYKGWYVRGVDKGTYAANWNLLPGLNKYDNFTFEQKDINDLDRIYDCDYFINTAAETHVDNSLEESDTFVRSNINGVHHILKLINQIMMNYALIIE